eukprot:625747-Alexandrium_andersonii.AAC.1
MCIRDSSRGEGRGGARAHADSLVALDGSAARRAVRPRWRLPVQRAGGVAHRAGRRAPPLRQRRSLADRQGRAGGGQHQGHPGPHG